MNIFLKTRIYLQISSLFLKTIRFLAGLIDFYLKSKRFLYVSKYDEKNGVYLSYGFDIF